MNNLDYDWFIDSRKNWPPPGRPQPPFGPTTLEILRSCPLRVCFERSDGYQRRTGYAARVGTAFHRTIQWLNENPLSQADFQIIAEATRLHFEEELRKQEEEGNRRPRERGLPRPQDRIHQAAEALLIEARHIVEMGGITRSVTTLEPTIPALEPKPEHQLPPVGRVEVEQSVRSRDALFKGRVDRVEYTSAGARLIDFKSSLRADLPERYERQLQLYAYLWNETRGEWPAEAEVIYPFTGTTYRIDIDPVACLALVAECRTFIQELQIHQDPNRLASPGDVCQVCEFRPWCKPFWGFQATEKNHLRALEQASTGLEGEIASLNEISGHWKVLVLWRDVLVRIMVPLERFPHLVNAQPGMRVRVLDMRVEGLQRSPQARVTPYSELFLLAS